jgi:PAP2 superfamily/Domain of unknown function (DUF4114)/Bacterial Ig-like domain
MDSFTPQSAQDHLFSSNINSSWSDSSLVDLLGTAKTASPLAPTAVDPIFTTAQLTSSNSTDSSYPNSNLSSSFKTSSFSAIDRALSREGNGSQFTQAVNNLLKEFFTKDNYLTNLKTAFGNGIDTKVAADIAHQATTANSLILPVVEILTQKQLNGAEGGFDATNHKIYLAKEIVATGNLKTIASVAIEEIGHYLDTQLNTQDAAGDEGQIFEQLVNGQAFTTSQLAAMQAEDDRSTIYINGQATTIEQATGDNGIYTVDKSGNITIDFLADAGLYKNQMAIFSLTGMESLVPGSVEFIKEAASRALSGIKGYVAIDDGADAGKFNLEANTNQGKYQGSKAFKFAAGDKVALMMVPNGTIQEIFNNPSLSADKRPLFSIDGANPGSFKQLAKAANHMVAWEDIRRDAKSDADFNDLVFQINGTLGTGSIDLQSIAPKAIWQDSAVGKEMNTYAARELVESTNPPAFRITLVNDTGTNFTDRITNDPSVKFRIFDGGNPVSVIAQFVGSLKSADLIQLVKPNESTILDRVLLEEIYGGKLIDGSYELNISTTDNLGQTGATNLKFTLDTTIPAKPTIVLDAASDSATKGDSRTENTAVTLTGKADASTVLTVFQNGAKTPIKTVTTDAEGNYRLTDINLAEGVNSFSVEAIDIAGNTNNTIQEIRRIAKDDAVITWNQILLSAIATGKTPPPVASRAMAMVETAVFDAVNNIAKKYQSYAITDAAPVETDAAATAIEAEAAAVEAAYTVLSKLFASQQATFDTARTTSLAAIADGQAKTDGLAFGKLIADKVIAARVDDGSATKVPYTPGTNPGNWQPTAVVTNSDGTTTPAPGVLPQWGNVKTFGILQADIATNRPAAPPALTSDQYATDFNQVKELGATASTTRTADQTEIAKFWADGGGTFTPPGHWNQIAQDVARDKFNSLVDNARLFAALNIAEADAAICCWDTKYTYSLWRPITAIRKADTDGNDKTTADTAWTSLLTTPNFPSYTSGHSTFSGAGAAVLTKFYGDNYKFSTTSPGLAGVTRSFTSFTQAADEAGMSRIYGGIHFMSDNTAGLVAGKKVGDYIALNLFKAA